MRIKVLSILIAVLLLAIVFSGCFEKESLKDLKYVNEEFGFEFNPPEGWNRSDNVAPGKMASFYTSQDLAVLGISEPYFLKENESLYTYGKNLTGSYYTRTEEFTNVTVNFTIYNLNTKNATINGMSVFEIFINQTIKILSYQGQKSNVIHYDLTNIFLFEKNNRIFEINFSYEPRKNSENLYEYYLTVVNESLNTIKIN